MGLMVKALVSGSSGLDSSLCYGHCIGFFGNTLYPQVLYSQAVRGGSNF